MASVIRYGENLFDIPIHLVVSAKLIGAF